MDTFRIEDVKILIAFGLGWALAQLIKAVVFLCKNGSKGIVKVVFKSGGMPSGHTASVLAALVVLAGSNGWKSVEFAILAIFATIVIYDAVNVRWAVGEYGRVINEVSASKVKVVEGHTIPEVIVGGIVGLIAGLAVMML